MARRWKINAAVSFAVAVLGSLVLAVSPAAANVSHAFGGAFGENASSPSNPYPLSGPTDVEVDQASHDVYVTDPANHRVEKFDASGHLLLMFGKGVDKSTGGNICTISSGDECQPGTSSSSAGGFETPRFLAVDNSGGTSTGDIYVGDTGDNLVSKFDSSGTIISSWGSNGQKDGSDAHELPVYGPLFGVAVGGPNGDLYVGGTHYSYNVWQYTPEGAYVPPYQGTCGIPLLKVNRAEVLFAAGSGFFCGASPEGVIGEDVLKGEGHEREFHQVGTDPNVTGFGFDPSTEELYQDTGTSVDHYTVPCEPKAAPCEIVDEFGSGHLSSANGVAVDGSSHTVFVANTGENDVAYFSDVRPIVTTGEVKEPTETSITMTAMIDPANRGAIVSCRFEYGFNKQYGKTLPCEPDPASNPPSSNFTESTEVKATVTGLSPGTEEHYRVVASNNAGASSAGVDKVGSTTQPPAIDGLASEHLTATSADLTAAINPNGLEASYRFEYGPSKSYGQVAPTPEGTLPASNSDHTVGVHLENLTPHIVYHYRLVATNADGATASEDHTLNFYPPSCPNENVRQQTQANYLPECRAYELVTPGDAGGTQIFADGPNTGRATNPSRFTYTGVFSTVPEAGGKPIDSAGDLYVATRTDTGWVSRYIGLPSDKAAVDGGPALGPPNSTPFQECHELYYFSCFRLPSAVPCASGLGAACQNAVLTNSAMDKFADFNDGNQSIESIFTSDFQNKTVISSTAPYVWGADGKALDRWPTNLATVPPGSYNGLPMYTFGPYAENKPPLTTAPGGIHALDCPYAPEEYGQERLNADFCSGDVTASSDMVHFVFATEWNEFAPGGRVGAPGSVYDNNTVTGAMAVASKLPSGQNLSSEPTDAAGDPLQIPGVSHNGSHILMANGGTGPCGRSNCAVMPCGSDYSMMRRCIMQPSHLYMRVDDTVTKDVSQGHDVRYIGMNAAGTEVYFISEEHLTGEDLNHEGTSLYMWSEKGEEEGDPLTLVSKADNAGNPGEPGNTGECKAGPGSPGSAEMFKQCGVNTYTQLFFCQNEVGGQGNCLSDNSIAEETGDIYFTSSERLEGTRGIENQENLYVFRNGHAQYVTTLTGPPYCYDTYSGHYCTRIERMQVSPDDSHMAFITNSKITQYENDGYQEMYTYEPSTRKIVCVSCIPSGTPPTSNVLASQDGLFMTDDGRTFFSTEDSLVHADTNESEDVYEYVEGRPQLITPGTGDTRQPLGGALGFGGIGGLVGVSADGRDVYFGSYQTLVPTDHNGLFFKVYDARSGGGFPANPPPPPCSAADECHGAGSEAPSPILNSTGGSLSGGNATEHSHSVQKGHGKQRRRHRQHGKRHAAKGHHRRAHRHGGSGA